MISCLKYFSIKKEQMKQEITSFVRPPHLVVVQIADGKASNLYIKNKQKTCEEVGIKFTHIKYESQITNEKLKKRLTELSNCKNVDGIILQLPIPEHLNIEYLQNFIDVKKDVDGFRPESKFKPCTAKGIVDWLKFNKINLTEKNVIVIGRSKIVGKPLMNLLVDEGATVTCCNSKTEDLNYYILHSDIVISAIGKAKYFNLSDFRTGQIIVDVGINRDENGKLCGDVYIDNLRIYVTPVPNGVGKLTVCSLLENTICAYKERCGNI